MKTVVGCLLNFRGAWAAMEPAMRQAPHFKPPQHPVLYLKPANTWRRSCLCILSMSLRASAPVSSSEFARLLCLSASWTVFMNRSCLASMHDSFFDALLLSTRIWLNCSFAVCSSFNMDVETAWLPLQSTHWPAFFSTSLAWLPWLLAWTLSWGPCAESDMAVTGLGGGLAGVLPVTGCRLEVGYIRK